MTSIVIHQHLYAVERCSQCDTETVCAKTYMGWICLPCTKQHAAWEYIGEETRQGLIATFEHATVALHAQIIPIERMFAPRDIAWFEALT